MVSSSLISSAKSVPSTLVHLLSSSLELLPHLQIAPHIREAFDDGLSCSLLSFLHGTDTAVLLGVPWSVLGDETERQLLLSNVCQALAPVY